MLKSHAAFANFSVMKVRESIHSVFLQHAILELWSITQQLHICSHQCRLRLFQQHFFRTHLRLRLTNMLHYLPPRVPVFVEPMRVNGGAATRTIHFAGALIGEHLISQSTFSTEQLLIKS